MIQKQKQTGNAGVKRPLWQKLMSSLMSALIFLLLVEIAAAVLIKSRILVTEGSDKNLSFVYDYDLLYYNEPLRSVQNTFQNVRPCRYVTNSYGFREDKEIPNYRSDNEFRILCVGDSSTFGITVDQTQTYPAQLQSILNARNSGGRKYQVINGGCAGFTSFQALRFMERWVPRLKPDMIIYSIGYNDSTLAYKADKDADYHKDALAWLWGAFRSSNTFSMINHIVVLNIKMIGKQKKAERTTIRVSPLDYKNNLKRSVQIAQDNDIALIFCPITVVPPYIDEMSEVAKEYSVPVVQTEDSLWRAFIALYDGAIEYHGVPQVYRGGIDTSFLNYGEMGELRSSTMRTKSYVFDDSVHPNHVGYRAIAEDLVSVIP
jgi:lysophospholipase L1-like esterase